MAPAASHLTVLPNEGIPGLFVFELDALVPLLDPMAALAPSIRKLTTMLILMTTEALAPIQSQIGPIQVFSTLLEALLGLNQGLLVATSTGEPVVSA